MLHYEINVLQPTKIDQTTSKLEIKTATPNMDGKYSCVVSNLGGTDQSGEMLLTVGKQNNLLGSKKCFCLYLLLNYPSTAISRGLKVWKRWP